MSDQNMPHGFAGNPFGIDPGYGLDTIQADVFIKIGNLTFYSTDVGLLIFCPLGAALGVLVSYLIKERSSIAKKNIASLVLSFLGAVFSGVVLGLMIALFFVGAIAHEVTALARVVAFSILMGFQSKHLWSSQEAIVKTLIERKLEAVLGKTVQKPTKEPPFDD
jgi:hypothetical protein